MISFKQHLEEAKLHGIDLPSLKAGLLPYLKEGYYLHYTNYDIAIIIPEEHAKKSASTQETVQGVYGWSLAPKHYGDDYKAAYSRQVDRYVREYKKFEKRQSIKAKKQGTYKTTLTKKKFLDKVSSAFAEIGVTKEAKELFKTWNEGSFDIYNNKEWQDKRKVILGKIYDILFSDPAFTEDSLRGFFTWFNPDSETKTATEYLKSLVARNMLHNFDGNKNTIKKNTVEDFTYRLRVEEGQAQQSDDEYLDSFELPNDGETLNQYLERMGKNVEMHHVFPYASDKKYAMVLKAKRNINIVDLAKEKKIKKMTYVQLVNDILKKLNLTLPKGKTIERDIIREWFTEAEEKAGITTEYLLYKKSIDVMRALESIRVLKNRTAMHALKRYLIACGWDAVFDSSSGGFYIYESEPYQIAFLHLNAFEPVALFDNKMTALVDRGIR